MEAAQQTPGVMAAPTQRRMAAQMAADLTRVPTLERTLAGPMPVGPMQDSMGAPLMAGVTRAWMRVATAAMGVDRREVDGVKRRATVRIPLVFKVQRPNTRCVTHTG